MTKPVTPPAYVKQVMDFVTAQSRGAYSYPTAKTAELTPDLYTDPDRFAREQKTIFKKAPIIVGHTSQLKQAGDHFTFDHLGQPLLIVRGQDDQIRAFYNVCRHRGVRLSNAEDVTRKASFVCPYHNWTYGLDGSVLSIPCEESFKESVSDRSLKPVPCQVKNGFIFVSLDPNHGMDMDKFLGNLSGDFDALNMPSQVFFDQTTRIKKTNWKLIIEAFQDGYHVVRLHRNTVGSMFLDNTADIMRVKDHLRAIVARTGFADMSDKDQALWDLRNDVSLAFYVFPNTVIVIHPDYISHLGIYPTATDESICVHSVFLDEEPKTDAARAHFKRAFDMVDEGVFNSEDFFVCEQAQIGLSSGVNTQFPLSDHEVGLKMFHDIVNEHLVSGTNPNG